MLQLRKQYSNPHASGLIDRVSFPGVRLLYECAVGMGWVVPLFCVLLDEVPTELDQPAAFCCTMHGIRHTAYDLVKVAGG